MNTQTITFKNSTKIEKLLYQLIGTVNTRSALDSDITVTDVLYDDTPSSSLIEAIFENKYISKYYDGDTIVDLLNYVFVKNTPKTGEEFLKAFVDIFKDVKNDWITIIPLGYTRPHTNAIKRFSNIQIGAFSIVSPLRKNQNFIRFFEKNSSISTIDRRLLEHQIRQTGGFVLNNPLLVFETHGSRFRAKSNSVQSFRIFRQLHNLYTANYGERDTLTTIDQQLNPVRHILLLDKNDGELDRHPIWDGTVLLSKFDLQIMKKFNRSGFSQLLNLFTQNDTPSELTQRMLRALHFFSKGFDERDRLSRFLFYVISAEAIFSRDRDTPITATLADYVSLLTGDRKERLTLHKQVREIYRLRSSIVHSGNTNVSENNLLVTEKFVAQTLLKSIKCLLPPNSMKRDDEFFQELISLKLRLKSKL